jgi:uncharacterized protein
MTYSWYYRSILFYANLEGKVIMSHSCLQNASSALLSDDEIGELEYILYSIPNFEAMNLEALNGFLAAINCSPRKIPMGDYIYKIVGNENIEEELPFDNKEESGRFLDLLTRYHDHIGNLIRNKKFKPYLEKIEYDPEEDQEDDQEEDLEEYSALEEGTSWSLGFIGAISSFDEFAPILEEENEELLFPIVVLAFSGQDIPEMAEMDQQLTEEMRECLVSQLGLSAMAVYFYFHNKDDSNDDSCCCDNSKNEKHKKCSSSKMVH